MRDATLDDAEEATRLLEWAFGADVVDRLGGSFQQLLQTGSAFLVLEDDGAIVGAVRVWEDDEGIAWFDTLASAEPGAARRLVRAAQTRAQDRGIRYLRLIATSERLTDLFFRWGFRPVAHADGGTVMERRLPLLTVREQRREDADAIGKVAGVDPWPLAQQRLRGWFVLSDGDSVVGVVRVEDRGGGRGRVSSPTLLSAYLGRSLELWMIDRATLHAETEGFHTLELPAARELQRMERDLEDRRWFKEGDFYVKRLAAATYDDHLAPGI